MEFKEIPIDKIRPNLLQPREHFDRDKLEELANSIKEVNLLQPIVVRPKGKYFEIISGERRWKAYQIAGKKKIPALIKTVDNGQLMIESLIENVHREDLSVPEKIKALEKIRKLNKISNNRGLYIKLSELTGISANSIAMWYDESFVRRKCLMVENCIVSV
jgi:ParB/RepB/Spo0J family partition protein